MFSPLAYIILNWDAGERNLLIVFTFFLRLCGRCVKLVFFPKNQFQIIEDLAGIWAGELPRTVFLLMPQRLHRIGPCYFNRLKTHGKYSYNQC